MEPLVSVIIPVYNVRPYLCEALDSVLGQTYQNLEILIIDDGSDDGSERICDEYGKKDSRIIVTHQENKGLSRARNAGLDAAKGDFIAFLDSDDAFCPNMLRMMVDAAQKYRADLVECNFGIYHTKHRMNARTVTFHSREVKVKEGLYAKETVLALALESRIYSNAWNKLYRRRLWNTLRYPEGHLHEDVYVFQPLLSLTERIYILSKPLYMHRVRPGSIATTYTVQNIKDLSDAYVYSMDYAARNTALLFSEEKYSAMMQVYCRTLMARYARLVMSNQKNKPETIAYIRKEIKSVRDKINLRECSVEIKGATFLYDRTPPFVFALISRTYYSLRILALKVFPQ